MGSVHPAEMSGLVAKEFGMMQYRETLTLATGALAARTATPARTAWRRKAIPFAVHGDAVPVVAVGKAGTKSLDCVSYGMW